MVVLKGDTITLTCGGERREHLEGLHRPGRKPPFSAVNRRARPYKRAVQNPSAVGNTESAQQRGRARTVMSSSRSGAWPQGSVAWSFQKKRHRVC